jgi:hypothetical protein
LRSFAGNSEEEPKPKKSKKSDGNAPPAGVREAALNMGPEAKGWAIAVNEKKYADDKNEHQYGDEGE